MTDFEIRTVPQQHLAALRLTAPMDGIGEAMGQAFSQIYVAVTEAGAEPVGPPLARYFSFGGPTIDFECAIPVAAAFGDAGDVHASNIDAGEAVAGTHIGPYDTIGETWEAATRWIETHGHTPSGPGWESYVTDPSEEPDPSKWVTEIYLPVT